MIRIGISGSFGGANLGDEAILASMVAALRSRLPELHITVFSLNPSDTLLRHDIDHAISTPGLSRTELLGEVFKFDLLLLGGGGILFDFWVKEHLREALLAEEAGVPVMVYAVGAGPLEDPVSQEQVVRCLEDARIVTVRDMTAARTLEKIGVTRDIDVAADAAMLFEPEPLPEDIWRIEGLEGVNRIIGMSVREPGPAAPNIDIEHYHIQLASAADYLVDRLGAKIAFVPMEPQMHDVQQSHAVIARMYCASEASVIRSDLTSGQVLSLVRGFSLAVGMRLHFLIFAALQGVPFVALPYASKVTGFIEQLEMQPPPGEGLTIGRLLAYIDQMWDRQDDLRRQMSDRVPHLQELADDTARRAAELAIESAAQREGMPDATRTRPAEAEPAERDRETAVARTRR